jgi:hypothetical protein
VWLAFASNTEEVQRFWSRAIIVSSVSVFVPHWLVIGFAAILPARRAIVLMRIMTRQRKGLCLACGYDLRETPDKCPECGAGSVLGPAQNADAASNRGSDDFLDRARHHS